MALLIGLPLAALAVACSSNGPEPGPSSTTISQPGPTETAVPTPATQASTQQVPASSAAVPTPRPGTALLVNTLITGLSVPWGLGFLPDGTALVTGRDDGSINSIAPGATGTTSVGTVDGVAHGGEGGLLGLAVSPGFATDGVLYIYYTAADNNRIATVVLRNGALSDQTVILDGIPKGGIHNGGRMTFGPDGLLYVGTGESGDRPIAQDLSSLGGKILRLSPDGSPAPGNPFPDAPYVYTYGHRNVQGLAFDDRGRLWASEFGQNTWDELNLITAGGNYGWPEIEGQVARDGFVEPERVWPTDAASPSRSRRTAACGSARTTPTGGGTSGTATTGSCDWSSKAELIVVHTPPECGQAVVHKVGRRPYAGPRGHNVPGWDNARGEVRRAAAPTCDRAGTTGSGNRWPIGAGVADCPARCAARRPAA
jgi:glucose/arabinose dehydrogenase